MKKCGVVASMLAAFTTAVTVGVAREAATFDPNRSGSYLTEVPGKLECPDLNNGHDCAGRFEKLFLAQHSDIASRNKDGLRIKLLTGTDLILLDPHDFLMPLEVQADGRFLILRDVLPEASAWSIVDRQTGAFIRNLSAYPLFSPDHKTIAVGLTYDATPGMLEIYTVGPTELSRVYEADTTMWAPANLHWRDTNTLEFHMIERRWNGADLRFLPSPALLQLQNGAWNIRKVP